MGVRGGVSTSGVRPSLRGSRPEKVMSFKKIISLVICIFRGHIRAHMKGNEMLFEIIYIHCGLWM